MYITDTERVKIEYMHEKSPTHVSSISIYARSSKQRKTTLGYFTNVGKLQIFPPFSDPKNPPIMTHIAIENDHRNSELSH